jgi:hypothetical protein
MKVDESQWELAVKRELVLGHSSTLILVVVGECVRFVKDRFKHDRKLNMSRSIASQAQSRIFKLFLFCFTLTYL